MIDRNEVRLWADHHQDFGHWVDRAIHDVAYAFTVLARLRYDRPWARQQCARKEEGAA